MFCMDLQGHEGSATEKVKHIIPIAENSKPVQKRPYPMNPKYSLIIKEEIDKLIDVGFICEMEHIEWVSPIVIVMKKNGKIRVCGSEKD